MTKLYIDKDDCAIWYYQDLKMTILHRADGPAVEWKDGTKEWYIVGKRHRKFAPAVIYSTGRKEWWEDGELHNLYGPSIEGPDCDNFYFYRGKHFPNIVNDDEWFLKTKILEKFSKFV